MRSTSPTPPNALRHELALQHRHPLAMLDREALRDRDGFLVLDLARQPAPALRVGHTLTLGGKLRIRPGQGLAHLAHAYFGVDHRFPHAGGDLPQLARTGGMQRGLKRVPQPLEQTQVSQGGWRLVRSCLRERGSS